jgi:hypothetical protein
VDFSKWRPADVIDVLTLAGSVAIILIGWTTKKYVDGRMSELVDLIQLLVGGRRNKRRRPLDRRRATAAAKDVAAALTKGRKGRSRAA